MEPMQAFTEEEKAMLEEHAELEDKKHRKAQLSQEELEKKRVI